MNNKQEDVVAGAVISKWKNVVSQQSSKIGTLADNVVLPKNERFSQRVPQTNNTELQNVGSEKPDQTHILMEPELAEKKVEHFPIFMIGISIVQNELLKSVMELKPFKFPKIILFYSFDEDLLAMKFGYDPYRRHEIWRHFTVMLVHGGYSHLWGNLVMKLILGVFLEIVHEWKRIAVIYFASVFGGSLCVTVLDNTSYSVGASGGVMGLLFAHLATIILNWNEMDRKLTRFFCVGLYIVYDIGTDVYSELYLQEKSNTSHASHFGGAITGFLMSILVLKNFKKLPWEETMQKICVGILTSLFVIVLVINVIGSDFPPTEWNFDYEKSYSGEDDGDVVLTSTLNTVNEYDD